MAEALPPNQNPPAAEVRQLKEKSWTSELADIIKMAREISAQDPVKISTPVPTPPEKKIPRPE